MKFVIHRPYFTFFFSSEKRTRENTRPAAIDTQCCSSRVVASLRRGEGSDQLRFDPHICTEVSASCFTRLEPFSTKLEKTGQTWTHGRHLIIPVSIQIDVVMQRERGAP